MQGSKTLSKTITTRLKKGNFRPRFVIFTSKTTKISHVRQIAEGFEATSNPLESSCATPPTLAKTRLHCFHHRSRRTSVTTSLKAIEFDGFSNTKHTNSWGKRTKTNQVPFSGWYSSFWEKCRMPTWGIAHAHFKPVISILRTFRLEGTYNWYMNNVDHILRWHPQWRHSWGSFAWISVTCLFILSVYNPT